MVVAEKQQRSLAGILTQGEHLGAALEPLRAEDFRAAVPGRAEQVHDLVAELVIRQSAVLSSLDQPTSQRPCPLAGYLGGMGINRRELARVGREVAAHESGPALVQQYRHGGQELRRRLEADDAPDVVLAEGTALRTLDLVRVLGVEFVLNSDDLHRALPGQPAVPVAREALADAVRVLADVLRRRHPGHSVEVRIPPFAAVQCGAVGEPRHTRGTPPTVVECDPAAFLRLGRGRLTWADAVAQGEVRASGVRADISEWLPLY